MQKSDVPKNYEREKQILSYRLFLINQTLQDNYNMSGTKIQLENNNFIEDIFIDKTSIPVLYLKEYACSDCYIGIIKAILKRIGHRDIFLVISHITNKQSINLMIDDGIIPADKHIIWIDDKLHSNSGFFQSTTDLLILNPNMTIRFFLPLDFLKENYFFEEYISFLENQLKQESIN